MGFGQKTDLATGRTLDLNKTYRNIIKPAVTSAGYDCVRADEIQHSGVIDVPMYGMLFGADLVVADLSTSNLNAIFELGVRHALRPRATIIMAENKFTIPFDASHIVVRHYEHLGPDIGFDEAMRMRDELTKLATALKDGADVDSPVYLALPDLHARREAVTTRREAAMMAASAAAASVQPGLAGGDSYAAKLQMAREAIDKSDFAFAKDILLRIYKDQTAPGADGKPKPARPGVVQQLALATYKAGDAEAEKTGDVGRALAGYAEAEALLRVLDVETTTDPETLGLWSALHKRRAEISARSPDEQKQDLDEAIRAVERGFAIQRDFYNGTNLAYLLNSRAARSSGDDRIADNVLANRVRREVVVITAHQLATLPENGLTSEVRLIGTSPKSWVEQDTTLRDARYWVAASHAESLFALGDPSGQDLLRKAIESAPVPWMAKATTDQVKKLQSLLAHMRE
jgi:hypothetical protein